IFSRLHYFKVHQKTHIAVREEYMCFECEKTFTSAEHLKRHQRIHTGGKPYKCSHCDKRFTRSGTLKTHEMIHTGEKPYHCTACGKCFNRSSSLHRHTKSNHSK
uniref:C2H2-type domain-containing protein n=1 Tax=Cyprinus carpio TaxID=7962 RepID=A0A8C2DWS2_CYPCA